jgi:hypothetical protein
MDPIVRTQQNSEVYRKKISIHYHKAMNALVKKFPEIVKKVPRTLRSLLSKWLKISVDCQKFSGALSHIIELDELGQTYADQLEHAKGYYQQRHKKGAEFSLMVLLKDNPKWQIQVGCRRSL